MNSSNKRIAKNTLMLYIRMILITLVSLYTSRVVLNVLGVDDFGIYNVVGGIVVMLGFLNSAMSSATQRFLAYELGRNDEGQLKKVFKTSITIHILIAVVVLLLAETIGVWFLNYKMVIPPDRMDAANWVLQFSILTFCTNIFLVPYNALIIAHEKMTVFAYVSILEVALKLAVVFVLSVIEFDKLELYGLLIFVVAVIMFIVYKLYCQRHFAWSKFLLLWDKTLIKTMLSFCGWSTFGGIANVSANQGINMILNLFYGVVVNTAMGIANQVSAAMYLFVSNFQTAFNPQLIKSYVSPDKSTFINLIIKSSKFSFLLMFLISLPVLMNTEQLIHLWLGKVPQYSVILCQWWIIFILFDALQGSLWISVQATGKIKTYQIIVSTLILLNLPLVYLISKLGWQPHYAIVCKVILNGVTFVFRIIYLQKKIYLPVGKYLKLLLFNVVSVVMVSSSFALFISHYMADYWILSTVMILSITVACILLLGLVGSERKMLFGYIRSKVLKN